MAKAAKTATAMTTAKETSLTAGFDSLQKMAAFSEEMDGLSAVFEQIKIPIGGVTYFEMPGDDPEKPETAKEFSAVILYHHPMRAYYKEKYTGGNNPPDCGSFDAVEGATGYQLFRTVAGTGGNFTWVKNSAEPPVTNYGLETGTIYYFKVRAYVDLPDGTRAYGQFSEGVPLKSK